MLQIVDEKYSSMKPINSAYNAVCVLNPETAKLVFNHSGVDFVFAMNETTGKFVKCNNLQEVIEFYVTNNETIKSENANPDEVKEWVMRLMEQHEFDARQRNADLHRRVIDENRLRNS